MTNVLANEILRSDLKRLRDASLNCLLDSDNNFALHIVPLSDIMPESLPVGFFLARSVLLKRGKLGECKFKADLNNLRRHFGWLPFYIQPARSNKTHSYGHFCHRTELFQSYSVSPLVDDKPQDFGVVLWTHSLEGQIEWEVQGSGRDLIPIERGYSGGKLTTAESEFLDFTLKVGNLLRVHNLEAGRDAAATWISFLVKYLWKFERPEVSRGFATVEEIRQVALNAIDHFLQSDSSSDARSQRSFLELTQRATDQDHDAEEQWPPDHGWHFCSAEAAFRGVTFVVNGKPWLLLKLLANRVNRPVSVKELLQEIDPNADIGVESLRTHLSRTLRPILKKAFHLREGVDPIPNLGRGVLASWKIDESVFPTVTEIQRWRNEDATRL